MEKELLLRQIDSARESLLEIETKMSDPSNLSDRKIMSELGREHRRLKGILQHAEVIEELEASLDSAKEMLTEDDEELRSLAEAEVETLEPQLEQAFTQLRIALTPSDPEDARDAIIEIRAGTGGDEAGLFAGDLYRMYQRFCERNKFKLELISGTPSEMGGYKEIVFAIRADDAFGTMKYEGGVHRVQRVPETESQGRIHTSAASVAVLPEAEEVDIDIDPKDLRIDVFRSSGPGGQSVNTTDSAVRITYLPTNLVVTCQDEKSQHKNKDKAMRVLRARLYEQALSEEAAKRDASRKSLVGTGDRSAKIRTYNFPQGRVTDHRINLTLYRLEEILDGDLEEILDALRLYDAEERLKSLDTGGV